MEKITGEEPAYPVAVNNGLCGLTIRQRIAMAAMQGILSARTNSKKPYYVAREALEYTDELIRQLNEESNRS